MSFNGKKNYPTWWVIQRLDRCDETREVCDRSGSMREAGAGLLNLTNELIDELELSAPIREIVAYTFGLVDWAEVAEHFGVQDPDPDTEDTEPSDDGDVVLIEQKDAAQPPTIHTRGAQ